MEAAAAATVFRHANILSPPKIPTARRKWRRLPPAVTVTPTDSSALLPRYRQFLLRCSPPERHLSSSIDEPTSPARPNLGHPPSPNPIAPPPPTTALPPAGKVFDTGPDHSWDANTIGSPVVKRYVSDDKERWLMWYHGSSNGDAGDSIGLAISNNGIHWERGPGPVATGDGAGQVFDRSTDWWAFDTHSVRPSQVLIMSSAKLKSPSSVYWLYYTGYTPELVEIPKHEPFFKSLPGLAISQDGRHWARIEGEHHTGALLDAGSAGEWDSQFLAAPKVVYHGPGDLRMYYHSFDLSSGHYAIGIARSRDGIKWVKLGKLMGGGPSGSFDEGGVRNAHVVGMQGGGDGGYVMAYEGVSSDGRTSVGLAVSMDGLKDWQRCREEAVLKPSEEEDGWDELGVGAPCLVQMDGGEGWRLYYRGVGSDGRSGIGLAISHGPKLTTGFERWTGFHLL